MANDHRKTPLSGNSLQNTLRAKSRHRREELAGLAAASPAPHPIRNDLMPKLELVERALADLVLPARNVRKIEPAHLREVANAISSFGFCAPVLIDGQDRVLDGVIRVKAAEHQGLTRIP